MTWPGLLGSLLKGTDLSSSETAWAMDRIMSGDATAAQIAGFLIALRAKGETVAEVRGLADSMVRHAVPIEIAGRTLDIVGTGGDQAHTVNISTMAAIVAAGAGAQVVKHGNRAASSSSGSADVLEALGISLDLSPAGVAQVAQEAGITFCFAQTFHPSFRFAGAPRRELGVPTAFNLLGPLTNPARAKFSAVGVADERVAPLIAGVFAERGTNAVVMRGDDGLDELTVTTTSSVWWVHNGTVSTHVLDPRDFGVDFASIAQLRGGDAAHNAGVVELVCAGDKGPIRDAVVLNAGIALALLADPEAGRFGTHVGLNELVAAGVAQARDAIDSGAAAHVVQRWRAASNSAQ